ncbi:MAG: 16S rRNA (adenine(1518)-N(6)/adenine(1519)-N(6))-dimethyltransferase RsmA [Eubacteriales bacterium]|nr:16S rRNA (adenine(1518)-N(6)/adenine(1519)-N(6))-dimethyltransferase RsmA [Eubacteriales bacterium]MDD4582659.1 16S rRNA (adenine(1518)-N(6)/adenine(1519)-N(6))-dimethyltransferase RsmA [Eubacteriales bacterium]
MDKLYSPATIQKIKNKYEFQLSKSLGQNFLIDGNLVDRIIENSLIGKEDLVIEIGPGIGVLTAAAAKKARKVIAVEIDRNLIPILQETLAGYDNIEIINRDIMKTDFREIIKNAEKGNKRPFNSVKIIGNLPYYITTPIIMKILEEDGRGLIGNITIMMQKEVADRIRAIPGSKIYGALSVTVQYYCIVDKIASVSKEVFVPKPKVDSSVIRLTIRKESPVELDNEGTFFAVVKAGFGQRRKTLLNSLNGIYGFSKEEVKEVISEAGINPYRRAETLDMKEFAVLSNVIYKGIRD